MDFPQEQRRALRLLEGLENGTLDLATAGQLVDESDPALVYLIFTWLRNRYGRDHPAAEGVLGRLVELSRRPGTAKAKVAEGQSDPVVAWFEENYVYRDLDARDFVALVVEKLES